MSGSSHTGSAALRRHFDYIDADGNGLIDFEEFEGLLKRMSMWRSEAIARRAFATIDSDGNGRINFSEFAEWWRSADSP